MRIFVSDDSSGASGACADELANVLVDPAVRTIVVAGGNSPRELYRLIAEKRLSLGHLHVLTLDEYLGPPVSDPRTCANLLRREVAHAWQIPESRFHWLPSDEGEASAAIARHERELMELGGIDVAVLGLGRNGHVGFNEPGSDADSPSRVLDLAATSIAANAEWFGGEFAPARGVTLGMNVLLAAKRIYLLAFGAMKAEPVARMASPPPGPDCPASFLTRCGDLRLFLDAASAARLPAR